MTGELGGDGELDGLRFYGMSEALALELALPTRLVLERLVMRLAGKAQVEELSRRARAMAEPKWPRLPETKAVLPSRRKGAWIIGGPKLNRQPASPW